MSPRKPPRSESAATSDAPANAAEALARARVHGQRAAAESLAALRALLDAASFASGGAPSDATFLAPAAAAIDGLRAGLEGEPSPALLEAVLAALDAEIARWEERARDDHDARAVLRAFLGLREILWELGVRPEAPERPRRRGGPRRAGASRLERVPVEG